MSYAQNYEKNQHLPVIATPGIVQNVALFMRTEHLSKVKNNTYLVVIATLCTGFGRMYQERDDSLY